jgi:hypothetical protein
MFVVAIVACSFVSNVRYYQKNESWLQEVVLLSRTSSSRARVIYQPLPQKLDSPMLSGQSHAKLPSHHSTFFYIIHNQKHHRRDQNIGFLYDGFTDTSDVVLERHIPLPTSSLLSPILHSPTKPSHSDSPTIPLVPTPPIILLLPPYLQNVPLITPSPLQQHTDPPLSISPRHTSPNRLHGLF